MLIKKGTFSSSDLSDKIVLFTGGGGGIGLEAVRVMVWLGATVIAVDNDDNRIEMAKNMFQSEIYSGNVEFLLHDITDEMQAEQIFSYIAQKYGKVDVIFNNATITPLGSIEKVKLTDWDSSYAVNVRAPVMLMKLFLGDMKKRNTGIIVFVPSSGAAPYMGAYEVFKTAQVELCNTLVGELENTNIFTYSIAPGLVKTETALKGIEQVSKLMGIEKDAIFRSNAGATLTAEEAGTGFAISLLKAAEYHGREITSVHALINGCLYLGNAMENDLDIVETSRLKMENEFNRIVSIYSQQFNGWKQRSIFERQWLFRNFKKNAGNSAEQVLYDLQEQKRNIESGVISSKTSTLLQSLRAYYLHYHDLLQGYEKNANVRETHSTMILGWVGDIDNFLACFLNSDQLGSK